MSRQTEELRDGGFLTDLDVHFGRLMRRLHGETGGAGADAVELAAALVSNWQVKGHVCLPLKSLAEPGPGVGEAAVAAAAALPKCESWLKWLKGSPVVMRPGDEASGHRPLVLDSEGRLYLFRYWQYEQTVIRGIQARVSAPVEVDEARLQDGLNRLFPPAPGEGPNWQKIAALTAVLRRFCVISGGPGTGKTYTAARVLALLLEQDPEVRMALAAQTGKAAARLQEAIVSARATLACAEEIRGRLPAGEAFTLHRLLGGRPGQHRYRYNEDNPLPYDVVIVDEASMADMALMAKLMAALPANGRLILLGDRDQLSSVEAGAVLGDIGDAGHDHGFSAAHARRIRDVAGETVPGPADGGEKKKRRTADSADGEAGDKAPAIGDCIVILRYVYRTGEGGSLGALASAVNAGDGEAALGILKGGKADARWEALPAPGRLRNALRAPVVGMYRSYLEAESPEEALARFQGFRILCAHRVGPHGTERVNELVREILAGEGWLGDRAGAWYHGRPVMVTENDYSLRLFNGDIGITWIDETGAWVCFAGEGGVRKVRLTNMPMHETVYAMTVHKSQGSEFDEVLLVLAMKDSPILTRELIYTGLTRARRSVTVWGVEGVFSNGVRARISRESGLRDALWAQGD